MSYYQSSRINYLFIALFWCTGVIPCLFMVGILFLAQLFCFVNYLSLMLAPVITRNLANLCLKIMPFNKKCLIAAFYSNCNIELNNTSLICLALLFYFSSETLSLHPLPNRHLNYHLNFIQSVHN